MMLSTFHLHRPPFVSWDRLSHKVSTWHLSLEDDIRSMESKTPDTNLDMEKHQITTEWIRASDKGWAAGMCYHPNI